MSQDNHNLRKLIEIAAAKTSDESFVQKPCHHTILRFIRELNVVASDKLTGNDFIYYTYEQWIKRTKGIPKFSRAKFFYHFSRVFKKGKISNYRRGHYVDPGSFDASDEAVKSILEWKKKEERKRYRKWVREKQERKRQEAERKAKEQAGIDSVQHVEKPDASGTT